MLEPFWTAAQCEPRLKMLYVIGEYLVLCNIRWIADYNLRCCGPIARIKGSEKIALEEFNIGINSQHHCVSLRNYKCFF